MIDIIMPIGFILGAVAFLWFIGRNDAPPYD